MDVRLLGTGAASGWPNPFCSCASCEWMRSHDDIRGQTSALVDGKLLLDAGPETPRTMERLGLSLRDVSHMLFTHAHPDHFAPATLMWREWTHPADDIDVAGPAAVIASAREWVAPDACVRWHQLGPWDAVQLGDYEVRAIPANHANGDVGPPLLYDVTGPDGSQILWATDTGPLPTSVTTRLAEASYDAVFIEETDGLDDGDGGHLNLTTWAELVAELRRQRAVGETTTVVPVHLGHGNPSPPQLAERMAAMGAQLHTDGDVITLRASHATETRPTASRALVLGGARSGKSRWAEALVSSDPEVTYVATALPRPDDDEWTQRVLEHQKRRPATWQTLETLDVANAIESNSSVVVDCLTLWTGALLDDPWVDARIDALVTAIRRATNRVVIVSNEVGSGVVPATVDGRRFRDLLGEVNARVAAACDEVWLVTAGIPRRIS
jgi:adenosylcobinamide kinase/adenosylcobinamide-phosphate guanylyltransferase